MTLHSRVQTGVDKFNAPIYSETSETVANVLVTPVTAEAVVNDLQLYGHRAAYELCIPKGDTHDWTGCRVDFFGQSWRVYTPVEEWIEAIVIGDEAIGRANDRYRQDRAIMTGGTA